MKFVLSWQLHDIERLRGLALSGRTIEECASIMGRPLGALRSTAKRMRIGFVSKHTIRKKKSDYIEDKAFRGKGKITTDELKEHHCRWPIGDKCCGGERANGKPYCAKHQKLSNVPETPGRRNSYIHSMPKRVEWFEERTKLREDMPDDKNSPAFFYDDSYTDAELETIIKGG